MRCWRFYMLCASSILSGCGTTEAIYTKTPTPGENHDAALVELVKKRGEVFALPVSKIMVQRGKASSSGTPAPDPRADPSGPASSSADIYAATVVPTEGPHAYMMTPKEDLFGKSDVAITRITNSEMPKEVNGTFTDKTADTINTVGGIAVSLVSMGALFDQVAPQEDCTKLPDFVVPGSLADQDRPLPGSSCWKYTVKVADGAMPDAGAVEVERFESTLGSAVPYFPVPACLDVLLTVHNQAGVQHVFPVRIADPGRVHLIPLPSKGKISLHSVCSADVTDEGAPDGLASVQAALAAAANQAKAIEAAQKKPATTSGQKAQGASQ